jgi:hypothetical protein
MRMTTAQIKSVLDAARVNLRLATVKANRKAIASAEQRLLSGGLLLPAMNLNVLNDK